MKRKIKYNAFTVAELSIVIVLMGVIALIIINSLTNFQADKRKLLFKKAFSTVQQNVSEMISDENLYPYHPTLPGLKNTLETKIPDGGKVTTNIKTYDNASGDDKFKILFISKLKPIGITTEETNGQWSCTTADRLFWKIGNFDSEGVITIQVDINGQDTPPNSNDESTEPAKLEKDIFEILVFSNGKVSVKPKTLESEFIYSQNYAEDKESEAGAGFENIDDGGGD